MLALQSSRVKNAGYAIISTNVEGIITSFKPAAEKMLGYLEKYLGGVSTPAIWHDVN